MLIIGRFPNEAAAYLPYWKSGNSEYGTVFNLLVLPLEYPDMHFRLVPPYWSVAVELQMYALLFIAAARSEKLAIATLWFGVIYHLACMYGELGFGARYTAAPSAALSFAAGAVTYFWTKKGALDVSPRCAALAFILWLANVVAAKSVLSDEYACGPGYYFATFLFVFVVAGLAKVQWRPLMAQVDRALGEIAYPTFLLQWLAGFLTALAISPGHWRGWMLTLATIPLLLCMAAALALLNSKFIEPLRRILRDKNSSRMLPQVQRA